MNGTSRPVAFPITVAPAIVDRLTFGSDIIDRNAWPTEARGDMIAAMMTHSVHRLGAPSAQGEC